MKAQEYANEILYIWSKKNLIKQNWEKLMQCGNNFTVSKSW